MLNSGWLGVDLSRYELDDPLSNIKSNAIVAQIEALSNSTTNEGKEWTLRDLLKLTGLGCQGPKFVGGAKEVCDILEDFMIYSDCDGFNLAYATTPGTFLDVVEFVIPKLQSRGLYKEAYVEGSLRHKLFGNGDRLDYNHIAARYRVNGAKSSINDYAGTGRIKPKRDMDYVI